jgi:symplekin
VAIVRPAALSFIELQSSMRQTISEDNPFPLLDRNNLEYNFLLSQKSYSLVINAVSILAINRPIFYKDSATCLTWRTMDPPSMSEPAAINGVMTKPGVTTIQSHLKASCLTLLRNTLSVSSGESISNLLFLALSSDAIGMKVQAEKALRMAQQNAALKTGTTTFYFLL